MPMLPFHPAPGLGELLPGWFDVPQNPLRPDSTDLVPTVRAAVGNRVTKKPTMGELIQGIVFNVPDNPVVTQLKGGMGMIPAHYSLPSPSVGMSGMGCGCGGGCNNGAPAVGMGSLTMDGTGLLGTGLFAGGLDLSTWGPGEITVAAAGAFVVYSVFFTTKAGVGQAHRKVRAFAHANPRRQRNVEQGFWRAGHFHPIRASDDYEPDEVGERYQYASDKPAKRKTAKRKKR